MTPVIEPGGEAILVAGRDEIEYLPNESGARGTWGPPAAALDEGIGEAIPVEDAIPVEEEYSAADEIPDEEADAGEEALLAADHVRSGAGSEGRRPVEPDADLEELEAVDEE